MNRKEIIFRLIEKEIDEVMFTNGFKRRRNAVVYSRKIGTAVQKIEMLSYSYPQHELLIAPRLSVIYPEINELTNKMLAAINLSLPKPPIDVTFRDNIWLFCECETWFVIQEGDIDELSRIIAKVLETCTLPYLNDLLCIDDFINLYEKQDERLWMDDMRCICLSNAYAYKGDYEKGLEILKKRFGTKLSYNIYISAFQYFENKIKR